jgi:hypothetical protein
MHHPSAWSNGECWFTLGDGKKKWEKKREKPNGSIEKNVLNNYALPSNEMESIWNKVEEGQC